MVASLRAADGSVRMRATVPTERMKRLVATASAITLGAVINAHAYSAIVSLEAHANTACEWLRKRRSREPQPEIGTALSSHSPATLV